MTFSLFSDKSSASGLSIGKEESFLPLTFHTKPRESLRFGLQYSLCPQSPLPLSPLPIELALHLLSFFQPKELLPLRSLSRSWKWLAEEPSLWAKFNFSFDGNYTGLAAYIHSLKVDRAFQRQEAIPSYLIPSKSIVNYLALFSDQLISINYPGKIWNLKTGQHQLTLRSEFNCQGKIAVGKQIVAAKYGGINEVISVKTGLALYSFKTKKTASCLKIGAQPNQNHLFLGLKDGSLVVWDLKHKRQIASWRAHHQELSAVALSADYLITGSDDCSIKIWQRSNWHLKGIIIGHEREISSLAASESNCKKVLISGDLKGVIKVWDLDKMQPLATIDAHRSRVTQLAISGNKFISTAWDGKIKVWHLETFKCLANWQHEGNLIKDLVVMNDKILSCAGRFAFNIWDLSQDIENLKI